MSGVTLNAFIIAIHFHSPYIIYFLVHVNIQQNNNYWLIAYDMSDTVLSAEKFNNEQ